MHDGNVPPLIDHGLMLHRQGRLAEAEAVYRAVLVRDPNRFEAQYLLAHLKFQQGSAVEAEALLARTLVRNPRSVESWSLRCAVLLTLNRTQEALAACDQSLALNPGNPETHHNRALVLVRLKREQEALSEFDRALVLKPDFVAAHFDRANLLADLSRPEEALAGYDHLLAIAPLHLDALNNRSNILARLGHHREALAGYERVLAINPNYLRAINNRGSMLKELSRMPDALASFDRALAVDPDYVDALYNRGNTLVFLNRFEEACISLERALANDASHARSLNALANARASMCDWSGLTALLPSLMSAAREGNIEPFALLSLDLAPAEFLQCTRKYVRNKLSDPADRLSQWRRPRLGRIKIAYISSDFRKHPVGYLTARLFELHDRSRFQIVGISLGGEDGSEIRARLKSAFDQFHEVREMSDRDVARLISDCDVAVDLNGHTTGSRPGIFALRPVPIQVNYLGFAGTMGADFTDYILVDRIVVPIEQQDCYSEKLVHLPDSFLVNDPSHAIGMTPTRSEAGLPEQGIVFCCFNNAYKITPAMFAVWMRVLRHVEGSVLWLSQLNGPARVNLHAAATDHGIDPSRLIFAPRCARSEDHLARHRVADLFLDTLPYNAHTTAWDALWAGLPVLTCLGRTFPGRVGASLLTAVGMPELIANSVEDYQALAIKLAHDPAMLSSMKDKLAHSRGSAPLFDSARFVRHIEVAYLTMCEIAQHGESPRAFSVDRISY
jgi:protein O-GlcNAc transferase